MPMTPYRLDPVAEALASQPPPATDAERDLIAAALAWQGTISTWQAVLDAIDRVRRERGA